MSFVARSVVIVLVLTSAAFAQPKRKTRPPAKIIESCELYAWPKAAKLKACQACQKNGGWYVTRNGKCEDVDPDEMVPRPQLALSECSQVVDAVARTQCLKCIVAGGVFALGHCIGTLPAETPPVISDQACRGETVAPARRKRCLECIASQIGSFAVVGADAGRCMKDSIRFAAKFKLAPESPTTGYYSDDSCKLADAKQGERCAKCTARDQVFVVSPAEKCLKPAEAAKLARSLDVEEASAVPSGNNLIPNPGFEKSFEQAIAQEKVFVPTAWDFKAGTVIDHRLALTSRAAHGGAMSLEMSANAEIRTVIRVRPGKKYRLTFWAKEAAGADTTLQLSIGLGKRRIEGPKATATAKEWTQLAADVEAQATDSSMTITFATTGAFLLDDVELVALQ